ncbi:hypothetical protein [Rivibacter subsaxonicus]|uniref:Uncharacterized protein n=1 Tax=Rivibacter subsaxonicus TaxID=457575 RepID=A0A4Q7VWC6_9BURK|nr:hypothetical protein [Rivibacter subsaxonicus]RZU00748.1 hypothetical protein EV670_1460 [Rivibacter subsaxonicus]
MSLCGTAVLTKALTWGTLSAALSSALWLAAGDDDYPSDWLADFFAAAVSPESSWASSSQAAAEPGRAARWLPAARTVVRR